MKSIKLKISPQPEKVSFLTSFLVFILISGCTSSYMRELEKAEEYTRQGQYQKAIASYERHIEMRLELSKKPDWENPYFYYLLIGDLYLAMDDLDMATASYEYAEEMGVHSSLVADRYRFLAAWFEERGDYNTAIELLLEYRNRDPLLFDVIMDRIAREAVEKEEHLRLFIEVPDAIPEETPHP